MKKVIIVLSLCMSLFLMGCQTRPQGAVLGAGIGGTAGALMGGTTGAVVGGIGGAAVGAAVSGNGIMH